MKNNNNPVYDYVIDLNERGCFSAHVENSETGKIVFSFSNENEEIDEEGNSYFEYGELWLVQDGFMKFPEDVKGLQSYLIDIEMIEKNATIKYIG